MKETFQAIQSSEVESFIKRLGLIERFVAGEIKCHFCGDIITTENFKALTRRDDQLLFSCNRGKCLLSLAAGEEAKQ